MKKEIVKNNKPNNNNRPIIDEGKAIYSLIVPVKFSLRDVLQVIIGATLLAIPVAFTEETWNLGTSLPLENVLSLMLLSFIFVSSFVYYTYYKGHMKKHRVEFMKRSISTYLIALLVVGLILTLIQKAPWTTDFITAFNRTVIVTLPASMSAAIADTLK